MVTVKFVKPGDNSFSIDYIIRYISNFLRKSYLSQLCTQTRNFVITFLSTCKIFLTTDEKRTSCPGGAHVQILTGMLVLFFRFEIWPNPIFLGWQIF